MVNRVTGVTNMRYAVPSAEGRYRLRQGGRFHFCEQDKTCPMLPQAILPCTGCNARFDEPTAYVVAVTSDRRDPWIPLIRYFPYQGHE